MIDPLNQSGALQLERLGIDQRTEHASEKFVTGSINLRTLSQDFLLNLPTTHAIMLTIKLKCVACCTRVHKHCRAVSVSSPRAVSHEHN